MLDLQKQSGLPIELTDDFKLRFNPPMKDFPLGFARKFSEMVPVLLDPKIPKPADVTYNVYRNLYLPQHEQIVKGKHLTHDITIIPPIMLGEEFNKTIGHYHAPIPGTDIAHPEIYEVLSGHAMFLIQKMDSSFKNLLDVVAIEASAGDKIIYPPNYGHILINLGVDILVVSNWLCLDYKPLYEPIVDFHGMGYYVVTEGQKYKFVKNEHYGLHPGVRFPKHQQIVFETFGFKPDEPMYVTAMKNPKILEFLISPQDYLVQLSALTK
jgi:glucose-6-phosphate isomerase